MHHLRIINNSVLNVYKEKQHFIEQENTQQDSYSIPHLLDTVTKQWLDSDSVVTVVKCWQHGDYTANGSYVNLLLAVINSDYTVIVQSLCSYFD